MSGRLRNSPAHHKGEQDTYIIREKPDLQMLCGPSEDDRCEQNAGVGSRHLDTDNGLGFFCTEYFRCQVEHIWKHRGISKSGEK